MIAVPDLPDEFLRFPEHPLGPGVRVLSTTRAGGVSRGACASLNLGTRVRDDPDAVAENRRRLQAALDAGGAAPVGRPAWLHQVHGSRVIEVQTAQEPAPETASEPEADGAWTAARGRPCAILTADCLPIALARRDGSAVGALHAGWRSLAGGVVEAGVEALRRDAPGAPLAAWLGPCIGADAFEVGDDVREAFMEDDPDAAAAFRPASRAGHWLADLRALAARRLRARGVDAVEASTACTYREEATFYSHRRASQRGESTGRMATVVWIGG